MSEVEPEKTLVEFEPSEDAEEEFHPFDEISEEYQPRAIPKIIAADGLPTNSVLTADNTIPPLSTETLVCMEDTSKFVVRDEKGFVVLEAGPDEVERAPNGEYYKDGRVYQPIRPRCRHYVRQVTTVENLPDRKVHLRLCAARRTTEGTFMTVRDSAVYACSMREPRDLVSEELIDDFDQKKIQEGARRQNFSMFSKE